MRTYISAPTISLQLCLLWPGPACLLCIHLPLTWDTPGFLLSFEFNICGLLLEGMVLGFPMPYRTLTGFLCHSSLTPTHLCLFLVCQSLCWRSSSKDGQAGEGGM